MVFYRPSLHCGNDSLLSPVPIFCSCRLARHLLDSLVLNEARLGSRDAPTARLRESCRLDSLTP